jgi:hypothetical protein
MLLEGGNAGVNRTTFLTPRRLPLIGAAVLAAVSVGVVSTVGSSSTPKPPKVTAAAEAPAIRTAPIQPASRARTVTPTYLPVAPLKKLTRADLMLTTSAPLTQAQVGRLKAIKGVTASSVISTGVVRVGSRALNAMGVDPSTFRPFTPGATARSDALWNAIAHDQVAASYAAKLPLGSDVHLFGRKAADSRLGAVAAFDLPGSAVVLDRSVASQVGLVTNTVLLAAPDRKLSRLEDNVRDIVGDKAELTRLRPVEVTINRRPSTYRELYMLSAGYCPGLSWKVLAAIGQVESDHGRNAGVSSAGAMGPMQFLPSTWASYAVDGDGDGKADILSAYDAVPAASLYLCRNGAGKGGQSLYDAIFNYNHADWYVRKVLDLAARYQ